MDLATRKLLTAANASLQERLMAANASLAAEFRLVGKAAQRVSSVFAGWPQLLQRPDPTIGRKRRARRARGRRPPATSALNNSLPKI